MRSGPQGSPLSGTAWKSEQVFNIEFRWLAPPAIIYLAATFFLYRTIQVTNRESVPLWKSSPLALLNCMTVADKSTLTSNKLQDMDFAVKLKLIDDVWKLVETKQENQVVV